MSSYGTVDRKRGSTSNAPGAVDRTHGASGESSAMMSGQAGVNHGQCKGKDERPTSDTELRGFYVYSWASEVFVVCGMGSFIPVFLEQLARERGVLSTDHKSACTGELVSQGTGPISHDISQCLVRVLGTEINTASFAMYTFSLSVFLQALLIITMSAAADHGRSRKRMLLGFALAGAIACMLVLLLQPDLLFLAALLAIVANTCYGASSVLLNSFLPLLVKYHPNVLATKEMLRDGHCTADQSRDYLAPHCQSELAPGDTEEDVRLQASDTLLRTNESNFSRTTPLSFIHLSTSTKISSSGVAVGYLGSLIFQTGSFFIVKAFDSTLFSLRLVVFLIGVWWFLFTIPSGFWLRARPGPPWCMTKKSSGSSWISYAAYSWWSLGRSISRASKLKDVLLFLAAWFLLSDAIATVSGTAILFAKTSLRMKPAALALINVISTISGIVGAIIWRRVSAGAGLKPHQTILMCVLLFELVPFYGLLGYLPFIQRLGVGGLQQPWEMYALGLIYGFILGGLSSFCRAVFGELVPSGFEAAFYSLYAITDKGSSFFGPAVVGAITDRVGDIRPAFWFLAVLIAAPFSILLLVNTERGKVDAKLLSKELARNEDELMQTNS